MVLPTEQQALEELDHMGPIDYVVIEFPDEARAVRFERYLKSGSGRAFAKRHFEQ